MSDVQDDDYASEQDRLFFESHPERRYRLRRRYRHEVALLDPMGKSGKAVLVRCVVPGLRVRLVLMKNATPRTTNLHDYPEDLCRKLWVNTFGSEELSAVRKVARPLSAGEFKRGCQGNA